MWNGNDMKEGATPRTAVSCEPLALMSYEYPYSSPRLVTWGDPSPEAPTLAQAPVGTQLRGGVERGRVKHYSTKSVSFAAEIVEGSQLMPSNLWSVTASAQSACIFRFGRPPALEQPCAGRVWRILTLRGTVRGRGYLLRTVRRCVSVLAPRGCAPSIQCEGLRNVEQRHEQARLESGCLSLAFVSHVQQSVYFREIRYFCSSLCRVSPVFEQGRQACNKVSGV